MAHLTLQEVESVHGNKYRFLSKKAAKASAKRISPEYKTRMSVYRCSVCIYWHIGHNPQWLMEKKYGPQGS